MLKVPDNGDGGIPLDTLFASTDRSPGEHTGTYTAIKLFRAHQPLHIKHNHKLHEAHHRRSQPYAFKVG